MRGEGGEGVKRDARARMPEALRVSVTGLVFSDRNDVTF